MVKWEPTRKDVRKSGPGRGNSKCKGPGAGSAWCVLEMKRLSSILGPGRFYLTHSAPGKYRDADTQSGFLSSRTGERESVSS